MPDTINFLPNKSTKKVATKSSKTTKKQLGIGWKVLIVISFIMGAAGLVRTYMSEETLGIGNQGPMIRGPAGVDGIDGQDGAAGLQGEQGEQGIQGIPGAAGLQGEQGEQGEQGIQGIPGADGQDGNDGVDGQDGQDGQDGADGVDANQQKVYKERDDSGGSGQCGDSGGGWGNIASPAACSAGAAAVGWGDTTAEELASTVMSPGCVMTTGAGLKWNPTLTSTRECGYFGSTCLCTLTCQPGEYQDQVGQTSCKPCPSGTYQDQAGRGVCKPCSTCPAGNPEHSACSSTSNVICACKHGFKVVGDSCVDVCDDGAKTNCANLNKEVCSEGVNSIACGACKHGWGLDDMGLCACSHPDHCGWTPGRRGQCNDEGVCECASGFAGVACHLKDCPNKCGGHGECVLNEDPNIAGTCICNEGYYGDGCMDITPAS